MLMIAAALSTRDEKASVGLVVEHNANCSSDCCPAIAIDCERTCRSIAVQEPLAAERRLGRVVIQSQSGPKLQKGCFVLARVHILRVAQCTDLGD